MHRYRLIRANASRYPKTMLLPLKLFLRDEKRVLVMRRWSEKNQPTPISSPLSPIQKTNPSTSRSSLHLSSNLPQDHPPHKILIHKKINQIISGPNYSWGRHVATDIIQIVWKSGWRLDSNAPHADNLSHHSMNEMLSIILLIKKFE